MPDSNNNQNASQPAASSVPAPKKMLPAAAQAKEGEAKKNNAKRLIILIISLLLISLPLYFLFKGFLASEPNYGETADVNGPIGAAGEAPADSSAGQIVLGEKAKAMAQSENFDLLQISLEGSGTNVFDFGENEILSFKSVSSRLYYSKEGETNEIQAVINVETNKRAYVEVEYYKSGDKEKKTVKDPSLSYSHLIAIPDLEPDSVYKYLVSAVDLNQGKANSEQFVFYTGAGNISLVDILGGAAQKVFGWVLGK